MVLQLLLLHPYLSNITIDTTIVTQQCDEHNQHSISINKLVFISTDNELCFGYHKVMEILLYQDHFDVSIELCNS